MSAAQRRRARQTGTVVEVWRTADFGLDPDNGGPWLTICEHGNNVQHETRALAVAWSASPATWCEQCNADGVALDELAGRHG